MSLPVNLFEKLQQKPKRSKKLHPSTRLSQVNANRQSPGGPASVASNKYLKSKMAGASANNKAGSGSLGAAGDIQLAPLRSLSDFLLESARFQVPNFRDQDRWANRMFNNLLYYQTNYFLTSLVIFMAVGVMHPVKMFYGFVALVVAFGLFYYITNDRRPAEKFKRNHPLISVIIVLIGGYFIVYMLGSVVVFLMGIMVPLIVIFVHASMRLRNMKNKITNKLETVGLKRTPMGIFLEVLDGVGEMLCVVQMKLWLN